MSVGDGIFYSTILVVLSAGTYLLSKHKKWKYVWLGLGSLGVAGGIIGVMFWYFDNLNLHQPSSISTIGNITLGMKRVDVTLALGSAQREIEGTEKNEWDELLFYDLWNEPNLVFLEGGVVRSACIMRGDALRNSGISVMGIYIGNPIRIVVDKLGPPTSTSINSEGLAQFVNYPELNVSYLIEAGKVSEMCITNTSKTFVEEYSGE